jgi:hypothetical protein
MALIARILGVSLLTSALVAGLGLALLKLCATSPQTAPHPDNRPAVRLGDEQHEEVAADMPSSAYILPVFLLACVGGVIGAVAGAAREIVSAQRQKASNWADTE